MSQDYDNMAKDLLTDFATDISQFVLGVNNVEVLENIDTEQQTIVGQRTDSTKRIRVDNREVILHIELQLRDSTHTSPCGHETQHIMDTSWEHMKYLFTQTLSISIQMQEETILGWRLNSGLKNMWIVDATLAAPVDQRTQGDLLYAISLFGSIVHNSELYERLIQEELMQESKFYQQQMEKAARENAIKYILAALKTKFSADIVSAITPMIQSISDLQRLEDLHTAAVKAQDIETFTRMLCK